MSITPSLGSYKYDGARLTAIAQLLDMRAEKLLPAVTEVRATGRSRHAAIRIGLGSASP